MSKSNAVAVPVSNDTGDVYNPLPKKGRVQHRRAILGLVEKKPDGSEVENVDNTLEHLVGLLDDEGLVPV